MPERKGLIALLILVSIFTLQPHLFKTGLTYDGGLYASLGYSLYEHGSYRFNDEPGDVPPGLPILLAPSFYLGEDGMYLVPLLSSILLSAASFLLLEKRFKPVFAFLGALLIFSSMMIYTYSLYVLRDLPAVAFVMLSYLLYEKKKNLLLGACMALAFLTRYAALVYLLPLVFHAVHRREKGLIVSAGVFLAMVSPWAMWSYKNHGTPFIEHSSYYLSRLSLQGFYEDVFLFFVSWFFPPVLIAALLGTLKKLRSSGLKGPGDRYLFLLLLAFVSALIWPIKDERYLLVAAFPVVYFALYLLSDVKAERAVALFLVLGVLFQLDTSMAHVDIARQKYVLLEDAGHWLRDNTLGDSRVMTQSFRQIAFYAHRRTYEVPVDESRVEGFIQENNISYVVVDSYERTTPGYIYEHVKNYQLLKSFRDDNGYVEIYLIPQYPGTSSTLR